MGNDYLTDLNTALFEIKMNIVGLLRIIQPTLLKKKYMKNKYIGKWRITEMELWENDFIDMVIPGHILFQEDKEGRFQFGAVEGEIDYRVEKVGEKERLEFTWSGDDEGDPICGHGWAAIKENELHGKIYFHMGDESWFKAKRKPK